MIRLENVVRHYYIGTELVRALDGVNLEIADGEFVAIMGQSGSGKSTLMNILGCLDRPTSGSYYFDDVEVGALSDDQRASLRGRVFGFVFQSYNLIPRLSVIEQVELPLVYQGVSPSDRRRRAAEALLKVGLLDRANHQPTQLSGGQQQRVAIARSLVIEPRIVLADEPTGALDTQTGNEVMNILSGMVREHGITVIIVTHEIEVAEHAERVVRMRDGRIVWQGPPSEYATAATASAS
ncbi:MAG: ABC transporter ATP-binding protein [Dehalococcoidia bacterium]|nr:ABC transporter ATP-binding protein [Dehalococcoidia bacterium]